MFGRRRSGSAGKSGPERPAESPGPDLADSFQAPAPREGGPWDAGEPCPAMDRMDLGSLQVPMSPDFGVQLVFTEEQGAWVTVQHGASELQLAAFAAPKREAIWDDVRAGIVEEITKLGGSVSEREGTFGTELMALLPVPPGVGVPGPQQVRFIGVDGPRWFLRGAFRGAAASDPAAAEPIEGYLRNVVVVRGDHPVPPRDLLELRLPADAAQALAEQAAQAQAQEQEGAGRFQVPPDPFERGPEITETR